MIKALICDDDSLFHLSVKQLLKSTSELEVNVRSAYNSDEAIAILKKQEIDVIFLDVQMRTDDEGLECIPKLREISPELQIIMTSGRTDFSTVKEAMRLGASDYVPKDFNPDDLIHTLKLALDKKRLITRNQQQSFETISAQKSHVLIGKSEAMQKLRRTIEKMRASSSNVVITGETGAGKEAVARNLRGAAADGSLCPFVAVDSATIQSSTAESQLFGHEKGAFTGADRTVKGVFEEANGGTVYFDEIANMPLSIQAKLLRVLQEHEIVRLGSTKTIRLEFRVICATNRDLEKMVAAGEFKDDLLQRLNVLPIQIPPLRDRREDIPELISHFLQKANAIEMRFSDEAMSALLNYSWPGNVRELSNLISYLAVMADQGRIDIEDLPPRIKSFSESSAPSSIEPLGTGNEALGGSFYDQVSAYEKALLSKKYAQLGGNVSRLASTLKMDRSHLYTKLREYGIHLPN